ncbi:hypothetical protein PVAP13_6NG147300 [Panicum virgatum]|uniref:Uncharacterized protein n=1 Tax=Panicum virgatum TaxID=38727 RepID=A0A8T0R180_PANVG|nr:hypothetical protein PVAP13_6NG147300 [Panicum virgatum]KAG2579065.1 hypothetical protein PVAP13_6NG147300 [Panicum virgatum]KAG2579066.1 hypothetical protein PVAP13_6NG147300 [Panicum virgatum]KAG2579071.1 hypothetical protein PVAP13_6NG147300 [Panicum virgatum]
MMQLLLRAHFSLCQSPPAGLSLPPLVRLPWLWPTLSFFLSLAAAASCRPVNGFRLYRARRAGNKGSQGGGGEINAGLGGVSSLSCTTSFRRPRRGRRSGGAVGPVLWSKAVSRSASQQGRGKGNGPQGGTRLGEEDDAPARG